MSTTPTTDGGWLDRMIAEGPAAEAQIDSTDTFAPHKGNESDLNLHAADLLADPDPAFDPTRSTT